MIELLDPRTIKPHFLTDGWHYKLDYSWLEGQAAEYGGQVVLDVGCGRSPFGDYLKWVYGLDVYGVDRNGARYTGEFEELEFDFTPDIIMWASSLEHTNKAKMIRLFRKSMDLLPPGGLFIATIPIARKTKWFAPAAQTNLSPEDAAAIFGEPSGDFESVWQAYRLDGDMMRKYSSRFAHYNDDDPAYITAGVKVVKPAAESEFQPEEMETKENDPGLSEQA